MCRWGSISREVKKGKHDYEFSVLNSGAKAVCKNFTLLKEKSKCYVISVAF